VYERLDATWHVEGIERIPPLRRWMATVAVVGLTGWAGDVSAWESDRISAWSWSRTKS
jgi:hypothetical protein